MVKKNNEDSELKEIGINNDDIVTLYVSKNGQESQDVDNQDVVAKLVNTNGKAAFYIKFRRGQLFDPYGIDALKINARDTRYKKVDLDIYLAYKKYLETRREVFLTEAKRAFIRKGY